MKFELQTEELFHLQGIIEASRVEKEELEQARLKYKEKHKKSKGLFEERVGFIEKLEA